LSYLRGSRWLNSQLKVHIEERRIRNQLRESACWFLLSSGFNFQRTVQFDGADFEVDTNRTNVALSVCVIGETQQQALQMQIA
jgi:hypothetical protein